METTAEITKELKNVEKKLQKNFPNYDVNWATDDDGDFFVIANRNPFFYYVFDINFDEMKVIMFDDNKSYGSDYFKYTSDIYGVIVGLIKPYLTEKKSLKEGQNVEKVGKKSLKEYNKKDGRKYKIYGYSGKKETFVIYSSKRNGVFDYTMTKDYVLENFPNEECDSTDIDNLNYFVKYEGLGELIYGYMAEFNGEDYVDSIECVRNKGNILEVTINLKKEGTFLLKNGWLSERDATKFFGYYTCDGSFDSSWIIDNDGTPKIYLKLYIYSPNNRLLESLKESAKPINEKNVAKFVDELNEWCDDNIHFADLESAKSTRIPAVTGTL